MVFAARSDEPISVGVYPHRSRTQSVALKKIKANGADTHTHAHRPVVETRRSPTQLASPQPFSQNRVEFVERQWLGEVVIETRRQRACRIRF